MTETNHFLPEDQQEGQEDIGSTVKGYSAVISATDWTVATVLQQIDRGNIELNPRFQRREAWRIQRKSGFIESLILNVPVPQIVLAEKRDRRGQFIVIDGKQRLLTLRQFAAKADEKAYQQFALNGLVVRGDLNGLTFDSMQTNALFEPELTAFENSTIRTAVIRNWSDEDFLYTVFLRLNTGSVPLSPQELRQALHPGPFVDWVDEYSLSAVGLHSVMGINKPDVRMRDAELVIRYFAFRNFLGTYTGNLKPLLDDTAETFNQIWVEDSEIVESQRQDFERGIETATTIFGSSHAFRKWSGHRYESAINRAIFDVMMIYLSRPKVSERALEIPADVEGAFKKLCGDPVFRASVEGTTKSIQSIFVRLRMWGEVLQTALGIPLKLPELEEGRIVLGE